MSGYVCFSMTTRVARKAHRCIWCGQAIGVGEKYADERSVYDGAIQRHRWHVECHEASGRYFDESGEEEFTAGDNPRGRTTGEQDAALGA